MKKSVFALLLLPALLTTSCKNKKENSTENETTSTAPATGSSNESSAPEQKQNEPKTYAVGFMPDTLYLGKNKEAFIKLKDAKAVELSDADGKITGIELSYNLDLTNKKKIGEGSVYLSPNNFRLTLDNGNNISHDNYNSVTADAESTQTSTDNRFKLPAGTKPVKLNLFFDETRVSVGVVMK